MFTWEPGWEVVIGLEVHTQLNTQSKLFSQSPTAYGAAANAQASEIDVALPGVLPVVNQSAVEKAIKFGLAINAHINLVNQFARKNYFYPDLPKGYQISQFEAPIVGKGSLSIDTTSGAKTIGITRAHLEEDAGKSIHDAITGKTGLDLNRAGTPLLEIVSEPDLRSPADAVAYLRTLHSLVRYLDICDGNMQEGSFRCDANISVRPQGQSELGTRTELKNINSFRFVEKALEYEIERQIDVLLDGGEIVQETRLYDANQDCTRPMRSKEEAHDYRYFPDPDLPPLHLDAALIEEIRATLPELPPERKQRFISEYGLAQDDASVITAQRANADFFETVARRTAAAPQVVANWMLGEVFAALNKADIEIDVAPITAHQLAELLDRIADSTLSGNAGKKVFARLWDSSGSVDEIIEKLGLKQISDSGEIAQWVEEVLTENAPQVEQYRQGNEKVIGFLVGKVMQKSRGKANPQLVNQLLSESLLQK